MRFRLLELIFVIAVMGVAVAYLYDRPSSPAGETGGKAMTPGAMVKSAKPQLLSIGAAVPSFSLDDPSGQSWTYTAGQGPALIVLTATGCAGCLERIDGVDRQAYLLAQTMKVPVWNILVYSGVEGADEFVDKHKPSTDLVLCDPASDVSVRTLGGSDATCWLLIDGQGKLAWRGPAEMDGLEDALKGL
jgi:hypothetical protein